MSVRLTDFGILALSVYFPRTSVSQAALEVHDRVPLGKYTLGLGQRFMSIVTDVEDVVSLSLTAVDSVIQASKISYNQIGRLDVGTETILDKSKSIKTNLMQLFKQSGNSEVEGMDVTNACYGGTAALFNALAWLESSAWDGRYAVVVAADVAVYAPGPARATGGAAAVAMVLGKGAPIRFEIGLRSTCMGNSWDFYKPMPDCEYPVVKGKETVDVFVKAMDDCYEKYRKRVERLEGSKFSVRDVDFVLFHAPFNKMVVKSFARMLYSDFLQTKQGEDSFFEDVERFRELERASAHRDRLAQKAFVNLAKPLYEQKVSPGDWLSVEIGNCYTASLYANLAALISEARDELIGKRILMYSFGSGFAASMFSLRVVDSVQEMANKLSIKKRLQDRYEIAPEMYEKMMLERERDYGRMNYQPKANSEMLFPGTFFLKKVGAQGEREYGQVDGNV